MIKDAPSSGAGVKGVPQKPPIKMGVYNTPKQPIPELPKSTLTQKHKGRKK